jgi:hypothetical protein
MIFDRRPEASIRVCDEHDLRSGTIQADHPSVARSPRGASARALRVLLALLVAAGAGVMFGLVGIALIVNLTREAGGADRAIGTLVRGHPTRVVPGGGSRAPRESSVSRRFRRRTAGRAVTRSRITRAVARPVAAPTQTMAPRPTAQQAADSTAPSPSPVEFGFEQ